MHCFMFPGQPLTYAAGVDDDKDYREIVAVVADRTGLDLTTGTWRGPAATAQVALQVYGCAMSLYQRRRLLARGQEPGIVAEHSMGIYGALAACGALGEGDALELTGRIGQALAVMGEQEMYTLGCVIGLPVAPLLALAENNGVYLANRNTSRHFLLAGEQHAVEAALAEALAAGAFSCSLFPCDAPLHTPLIEAIAPTLREIVADYRFAEPKIPLLEHLEQDYLTAADIPDFLVTELCRPVNWEATFLALQRAGVTQFTEVGVGESLKKYNRWIVSERQ